MREKRGRNKEGGRERKKDPRRSSFRRRTSGAAALSGPPLPAEIVLHPSWWHRHAGITFDEDFFYHPARRVEAERAMEEVLYERFGRYGLGADRGRDLPVIGAVHLAAGFLVQEMLGCEVLYREDAPPEVLCAHREDLVLDADAAFASPAFKRFEALCEALRKKYGYLLGDVNFGGVLNCALDVRGQDFFMDLVDRPGEARRFLAGIARCIDRFTAGIARETGTTSISVNRIVRHLDPPVFLHSECSHTMISAAHYRDFLAPFDAAWSRSRRPFGIHHCGEDPHRFAEAYAGLPRLDFLDVGFGGDLERLRAALPETFLGIRLSPVEIASWTTGEIRRRIAALTAAAGGPGLAGVCCVNMDGGVTDDRIAAIFEAAASLRRKQGEAGPFPD